MSGKGVYFVVRYILQKPNKKLLVCYLTLIEHCFVMQLSLLHKEQEGIPLLINVIFFYCSDTWSVS